MLIKQIRKSYLDFFAKNNHQILNSSLLIPHGDPSLIFTNAGMVQFKNYYTGTEKPEFKRIATAQKCVRAGGKHNDLDNVGYTTRHHTFFEMLGNFAFQGDYFKDLAIELAWNYLTKELQIDPRKLYITVYHNDIEAYDLWKKITNFSDDKIIKIATNDNFWHMGATGPCGPCSEIFYDHGENYIGGLPGTSEEGGDRYIEIWNLVFMQYEYLANGEKVYLPNPAIDTGMGIERIAAVMQGVNDNYDTDIFNNLIKVSKEISGNDSNIISHKIVADHLRSSCFLIADGVIPSNEGRGYVLRRIMRRAMRHVHNLGYKEAMMHQLVPELVKQMGDYYSELKHAEAVIKSTLKFEEEKFSETLERGLRLLHAAVENLTPNDNLDGAIAFKLYDTFGFPLDLTKDILKTRNIKVNEEEFDAKMQEQKKRAKANWIGSEEKAEEAIWYDIYERFGATEFIGYSSTATEAQIMAIIVDNKLVNKVESGSAIIIVNRTVFYGESGGQVGDTGTLSGNEVTNTKKYVKDVFAHYVKISKPLQVGDIVDLQVDSIRRDTIKVNHSATHLLHKVLQLQLGKHVVQKGSMVTPDKLRFDFSHHNSLTIEQMNAIEMEVNRMIISNFSTTTSIMSPRLAIEQGAMALFGEKYTEEVRVVTIGESMELCGGTHIDKTGSIGMFKIINEESIASGIRRIEAVTGITALKYSNKKNEILKAITLLLRCKEEELFDKISLQIQERKALQEQLEASKIEATINNDLVIEDIKEVKFISKKIIDLPATELRLIINLLNKKIKSGIFVISIKNDNKVSIMISVSKDLQHNYRANKLLTIACFGTGIRGGGNAEIAQAGGVISQEGEIEVMINNIRKEIMAS